ncbi:hypothetical protein D3C78_1086680 [compost metagenome]
MELGIHLDPVLSVELDMKGAHFRHQFSQSCGLLMAGIGRRQRAGLRFQRGAQYKEVLHDLIEVFLGHPPGQQILIEKVPLALRHHPGPNAWSGQ